MKQWVEDALDLVVWGALALITLPLYLAFKLVDWIKER